MLCPQAWLEDKLLTLIRDREGGREGGREEEREGAREGGSEKEREEREIERRARCTLKRLAAVVAFLLLNASSFCERALSARSVVGKAQHLGLFPIGATMISMLAVDAMGLFGGHRFARGSESCSGQILFSKLLEAQSRSGKLEAWTGHSSLEHPELHQKRAGHGRQDI